MTRSLLLVILAGGILVAGAFPAEDDIPVGDTRFSVSPKNFEEHDLAENVKQISNAVMGIAEFVVDIRSDLKDVKEVVQKKSQRSGRSNVVEVKLDDPERIKKNFELAAKLEKFFEAESELDPQLVEKTKEELKKTMELNFVRILSAMLVSGTMKTQGKTEDILKLMRSTLNGELDFGPVVEKLPFIMRDSETKQFIHLLNVLNEVELGIGDLKKKFRQSDNDDDEDADNPVEDNKPATVQAVKPVIQHSITQQAIRPVVFGQQLGGLQFQPQQVQQQGTYGQLQKVQSAPVTITTNNLGQQQQQVPGAVAQQAQRVQVSQGGIPIQSGVPVVAPVAAAPQIPIIFQLPPQQVAAPQPTMPPKTGLQKFIEAFNTINISQLAEIATRLPELFEGVSGLLGGIDFIE